MEIAIYTGCIGDYNTIRIKWFNENGVHLEDIISLHIKDQDKPRELELLVNNVLVCTLPGTNRTEQEV